MINEKKAKRILLLSRIEIYGVALAALLIWMFVGAEMFRGSLVGFMAFMAISIFVGIVSCHSRNSEGGNDAEYYLRKYLIEDEAEAEAKGLGEVWRMLHELSQKAGLERCPTLHVIPDTYAQASMTTNTASPALIVTTAALGILSPEELESIIAHEIAHRADEETDKNPVRVVDAVASFFVFYSIALPLLLVASLVLYGTGLASGHVDWTLFVLVSVAAFIFGYFLGPMMRAFTLQQREKRADVSGALLVGSAMDMIRALQNFPAEQAAEAVAARVPKNKYFYWAEVEAHPSDRKRIAYLRKLEEN